MKIMYPAEKHGLVTWNTAATSKHEVTKKEERDQDEKKKIISRISSFRLLTHSGISHDSSLYTQFYFFLKIGKSGLFSVLVFCHTYMHVKLYRQTVYKNIKTGKHTLTKMCTDSDVDGRII